MSIIITGDDRLPKLAKPEDENELLAVHVQLCNERAKLHSQGKILGGKLGKENCIQNFNEPTQFTKLFTESDKANCDCEKSINSDSNNDSNHEKEPDCVQPGWKKYIGICCGLGSSLSFALALMFVKVLPEYDPFTLGLFRFFGTLVPAFPLLLYYRFWVGKPIFKPIWPPTQAIKLKIGVLLLLRGIFGCCAMVFLIYSIGFIEMPDASVIALSTPVFVSLVARIFLGEKCGVVPVMAALLTLCGVSIIARPPLLTGAAQYDLNTLIGTGLALGSMISSSSVFVILRYLRELHFTLVITIFGVVGVVECSIFCIIFSTFELPQTPTHWVFGLSAGLCTFLGQLLLTAAFKYEQAGPISLTRTMDCVFAFILQFMFLNIIPDIFSLVGTSVVISGVVIIVIRKWLSALPEDHPSRDRYWCFLK